jgi:hypothetical protein
MSALATVVRDDSGLTTAEYAVGTVAACGFGGGLLKILTSTDVLGVVLRLITSAISAFF